MCVLVCAHAYLRVCVCVCVCARARACVRVCVRACVYTCLRACVRVCVGRGGGASRCLPQGLILLLTLVRVWAKIIECSSISSARGELAPLPPPPPHPPLIIAEARNSDKMPLNLKSRQQTSWGISRWAVLPVSKGLEVGEVTK